MFDDYKEGKEKRGKKGERTSSMYSPYPCSGSAEVPRFELLCCCIPSCVSCTAEVIPSESIDDVAVYVNRI
jgi:hypothetical protein